MIEVALLAVSMTVRAPALDTLRVAMTQLAPQTSWVMVELWIVLLAACDPPLLVPVQLIPRALRSTLTRALNTSLGVWVPPLAEILSRSMRTGSLAAGSLKVWLAPGARVKTSR